MKTTKKKKAAQLKVLQAIYSATDCSNEVYDYATLHWKQAKIAEDMPLLVTFSEGVVPVDGDGFSRDSYTEGRGYRLTNAGYEALTQTWPERFPNGYRRFYAINAAKGTTTEGSEA